MSLSTTIRGGSLHRPPIKPILTEPSGECQRRSRRVQILSDRKCIRRLTLGSRLTKALAGHALVDQPLRTMKESLWLTVVTYLAYGIDKELWKATDYLKEQVRVLKEQQEKDKRILLENGYDPEPGLTRTTT